MEILTPEKKTTFCPPTPMKKRPQRVNRCLFPESDIHGKGYGDCHIWKKTKSAQVGCAPPCVKWTRYDCLECGEIFIHRYDICNGNIFDAMKEEKVTPTCP